MEDGTAGGPFDSMGFALLMLALWFVLLGAIFWFIRTLGRKGAALRAEEDRRQARKARIDDEAP